MASVNNWWENRILSTVIRWLHKVLTGRFYSVRVEPCRIRSSTATGLGRAIPKACFALCRAVSP
eukprot:124856-Prorocentrum_minimum.AAC.1